MILTSANVNVYSVQSEAIGEFLSELDSADKGRTMIEPKVSVIIATYNRAGLLPRAVNSVLNQTLEEYEIIIVDDASSDDTQQVIAGFNDHRIRSVRHEVNRGQSVATNTGIARARGEYVTLLDDDDEWPTDRLRRMVAVLDDAPPNVGLVYGWRISVDDSTGETVEYPHYTHEGDRFFEEMLANNFLIGGGVMMTRTSVAREIGGYDENMNVHKDWDFVTRVALKYDVAICPAVVRIFHVNHGYLRISDYETEAEGNRRRLIWERRRMKLFTSELAHRPRLRATLHRRKSFLEMTQGNWRTGVKDMAAAFMADPLDVSRAMLSHPGMAATMFNKLLRRFASNPR